MDIDKAIGKINKAGILLVFPITNKTEPSSLWSAFYPRTKMRWEWDDSGDSRVSDLWHLRTELSESRDVVYSKWFQGRATLFSRDAFVEMLAALQTPQGKQKALGFEAARLIESLSEDSPQSPRMLKDATDLTGKYYASTFDRALKELWSRLLTVGFGEFEDGAFPSLAIGSTKLIFEELWEDASAISQTEAKDKLSKRLGPDNLFFKFLERLEKKLQLDSYQIR